MFDKLLLIVWLLCLSYSLTSGHPNVKQVEIFNVNTTGKYCEYNGTNFTSIHEPDGKCYRLSCESWHKKVLLTSCQDPPQGCNLTGTGTFPHCCEPTCFSMTHACKLPNGTPLRDGEELNSTYPCAYYKCNNGSLNTTECEEVSDPHCKRSMVFPNYPYPHCCGAATLCSGRGNKRKRRSRESHKNNSEGSSKNKTRKEKNKQA
uniref:Putative 8.9 kDa family member n=1 Tax=Rhipicephalus pulchellus TaxID=72859 RepID=L7LQ71_RHIPC